MKGEVCSTVENVTRFSLQARRARVKLSLRVTRGFFRLSPNLPCRSQGSEFHT